MEEKKHNSIKVGQDSAITRGFNSADIPGHMCIINILQLLSVLACVTVVRVIFTSQKRRKK